MKVAFLGLGAIGYPMASHLPKSFESLVWNRTFAVAEKHAAEHGTRAATLDECAACEVVISCVPTAKEVRDLVDVMSENLKPGGLWIDCTSGDPATTRATATILAERNVAFVDAPVTGGVPGARAGKLAVMIGGAAENVERARPVLEVFAEKIVHVGDVGYGHAIKAVNNTLLAVNIWTAGECLLSLKKMGFDLATALEVINSGSGMSFASNSLLPSRLVDGEWPVVFRLALLDKDVRIAIDMMHEQHLATPVVQLVSSLFTAARRELGEDADYIEACKYVASMSGESW